MKERSRRLPFILIGSIVISSLVTYQITLSTLTHCHHPDSFVVGVQEVAHSDILPKVLSPEISRELPIERASLTLQDLLSRNPETSCPSDKFVLFPDRVLPNSSSSSSSSNNNNNIRDENQRRIPKIIHVTTKSRCLPQQFADNLQLWKDAFPDHSFVLHNDAALEALLYDETLWRNEFPHLTQALECSLSFAAKADLWRALVLWEFGGIYTDIDNAPRKFNQHSIAPDDQAYFVVEEAGYLSQYFMALEPKHPLLFLLIQATLHRLYDLRDVDHQYVPYVTGPGALKEAFMHFRHLQGPNQAAAAAAGKNKKLQNSNNYTATVKAGHFVGLGNTTVTVVGRRKDADEYVARNVIYKKRRIYQQLMNMTHFSRIHASPAAKAKLNTDSCWERVWWRHREGEKEAKM